MESLNEYLDPNGKATSVVDGVFRGLIQMTKRFGALGVFLMASVREERRGEYGKRVRLYCIGEEMSHELCSRVLKLVKFCDNVCLDLILLVIVGHF